MALTQGTSKKRARQRRETTGSKKKSDNKISIENDGLDFEIGFEAKGVGASISTSGVLKLGVGVAAVELDLKEPNNSKISYLWELYEIEGERDGCTVKLTYYFNGIKVKTETRTIPECEEDGVDEDEDPRDPPESGEEQEAMPQPSYPRGNPMDLIIRFHQTFETGYVQGFPQCTYAYMEILSWNNYESVTNYGRYKTPDIIRCIAYYWDEVRYGQFQDYEKSLYFVQESFLSPSYDFRVDLPIRQKWPPRFMGLPTGEYDEEGEEILDWQNVASPAMPFSTAGYLGRRWEFDRMAALNAQAVRGGRDYYSNFFAEIILEKGGPINDPPAFGNLNSKNSMNNDCCKMVARIYEVLDVDEILDEGVETPNRWIAAGGKKHTKNKSYLDLITFQMKMQDHLGIHPFRAEVTDVNAALEGDQSSAVEFANATAAAKQIVELLLENKGDSATRLNLMMRTAIAVGQILNVVSIIAKTLEGVVQYLGMPIRERTTKVKMPFDFSFGSRGKSKSGQGFGKGTQSGVDELDINTEEATEALLPKFMADAEQPIRYEDFDDRENDLTDIIRRK